MDGLPLSSDDIWVRGQSLCHHAAREAPIDVVRLLNRNHLCGSMGLLAEPPIFTAVFYGRLEVVKLLIKNNPNPNFKDRSGNTIHDIATRRGHIQIASLIRSYGGR